MGTGRISTRVMRKAMIAMIVSQIMIILVTEIMTAIAM